MNEPNRKGMGLTIRGRTRRTAHNGISLFSSLPMMSSGAYQGKAGWPQARKWSEKKQFTSQGIVREFYFVSGKIDV